eukprot:Plantae.Rhodophyta-Purpureofilum_apyrenoidigerum.ctg1388.p1 GENE.Plantae.Rhodophyta-Purpureofilum_apyrenoidigerum.ctg1388~~Plantae.Rhodophyta-Purpureofilum_apyrenoidigerum.ctg1388.p1  ORF type:complete len:451 (-),score=64.13 Plantae.Rhodophyta-Purpureofilum_apyrenoidigerum.ctg1388:1288-2640(-)
MLAEYAASLASDNPNGWEMLVEKTTNDPEDAARSVDILLTRCAAEMEPLGKMTNEVLQSGVLAAKMLFSELRFEHADLAATLVKERIAEAVFVSSFTPHGDELLHEMRYCVDVDLLILAWMGSLHRIFVKMLKAEDENGFRGAGKALQATVLAVQPHRMDAVISPILSLLIPLAQDAAESRRIAALNSIRHIVQSSSFDILSYHSESLCNTMKMSLKYRDGVSCALAIRASCEIITTLCRSRFKKLTSTPDGQFRDLHCTCTHTLNYVMEHGNTEQRISIIQVLRHYLEVTGQRLLLDLKHFLRAYLHMLEGLASYASTYNEHEAFVEANEMFVEMLKIVWPRVPSHIDQILASLLASILRARNASHEVKFHLTNSVVLSLTQLRRCGVSSLFDEALAGAARSFPELEPLQIAVMTATRDDLYMPRNESSFGDFENVYFKNEGDILPGLG